MHPSEPLDILHHFASVPDPRDARFITHRLLDLLVIALCATLSGATSFEDLAAFGRAKETWLRSLGLALPCGIPSHDTFHDLFCHLSPAAFQDAFTAWINAVCDRLGVKHVQIDGKAQRGSRGLERHLPASGQRLGGGQFPDLGTGRGRGQVQRDHRHPQTAQTAGTGRRVGID